MDPLRPVRGGDRVRMSAATQNAVLAAARAANNRNFGSAEGAERGDAQVLIKAAWALDRFDPFALGAVITTPDTDSQFQRLPAFDFASLVEDGPFGIMIDPAFDGCIGRGILFGLVPAKVSILNDAHQFVRVDSDHYLASAENGYARIIWKAGTSGTQWCLIALPGSDLAIRWNTTLHRLEKFGQTWDVIENGEASPLADYLVEGPQGEKGDPGEPGSTPTIGENGNWYIDEVDTEKPSRGATGATGADGDDGVGVPEGGTEGQVLAKKTGTNYDTEWVDQTGGSGGSAPEEPLQHTTLGEVHYFGDPIEGLETENEDTWTYGDKDESANLLGLRMWIQTRQGYWHNGDKKWYAFFRLFTFSTNGALYSVSAETRVIISETVTV